jgi:polyhydroxyalkanoate synthesis repressor PhaR
VILLYQANHFLFYNLRLTNPYIRAYNQVCGEIDGTNPMLVIKRYPNRKLYDTEAKGYITLEQLARLIREGQEIQVIDNVSGEDLTAVVLTQIILEQEKKQAGFVPSAILAGLVQSSGRTLNSLRKSLTTSQDLIHQIDTEIDQRIQGLINRGELAEEEARRWREKLLAQWPEDTSELHPLEQEMLSRLLTDQGAPSREDLRQIALQLDALAAEIESLQTFAVQPAEPNQSTKTGNFSHQEASNE